MLGQVLNIIQNAQRLGGKALRVDRAGLAKSFRVKNMRPKSPKPVRNFFN